MEIEFVIGVGLLSGAFFFVVGMLVGAVWERWRIEKIQDAVSESWQRTRADKVGTDYAPDEHEQFYVLTGTEIPDYLKRQAD